MLVLSRKVNQTIVVNDNIEIMIVDIKGDQIKLGISAPKNVKVFRKEIYEEIKLENKSAMAKNSSNLLAAKELLKKGKKPTNK